MPPRIIPILGRLRQDIAATLMSRAPAISRDLEPGDLVLGDRGFCSYAHLALLAQRRLHAVFQAEKKEGKGKGRGGVGRRICRGCHIRGGCWRRGIRIRSSSGSNPSASRHG